MNEQQKISCRAVDHKYIRMAEETQSNYWKIQGLKYITSFIFVPALTGSMLAVDLVCGKPEYNIKNYSEDMDGSWMSIDQRSGEVLTGFKPKKTEITWYRNGSKTLAAITALFLTIPASYSLDYIISKELNCQTSEKTTISSILSNTCTYDFLSGTKKK